MPGHFGPALSGHHSFLAALGAEPVQTLPAHADRALDVAGAGRLGDLVALTGSPGAVLSLVDFTAPRIGVPLSMGEMAGEPDGRHGPTQAAALAEDGRFRVPIEAALRMADAAAAHARADRRPHRGKLALTAPMA